MAETSTIYTFKNDIFTMYNLPLLYVSIELVLNNFLSRDKIAMLSNFLSMT